MGRVLEKFNLHFEELPHKYKKHRGGSKKSDVVPSFSDRFRDRLSRVINRVRSYRR